MAKLETVRDMMKGNGAVEVSGFTGGVRSLENMGLEAGDTWQFPDNYTVYNGNYGQFIIIELLDANGNKTGDAKPFYPSTFTKRRTVYEEKDGKIIPTSERVHTLGAAADLFRTFGDVAKAMDTLKGKKCKVTKIDTYKTKRWQEEALQDTQIATIDFV